MIETLREGKALDTYVGSCECGAFYRVPLEDIEGPLDKHGTPIGPLLSCPTPHCGRVVFLKREDSWHGRQVLAEMEPDRFGAWILVIMAAAAIAAVLARMSGQ